MEKTLVPSRPELDRRDRLEPRRLRGRTSGHFFLNGLVKGDWYDLKANIHTVPAYETFSGNTWGAKGETGFRFGGSGFYVEPVADIAWTTTHLDDADFAASGRQLQLRFGHKPSWLGRRAHRRLSGVR